MLLLNTRNTLELLRLFVRLGQLIKFFSTSGDRKNCYVLVCQGYQYTGWHQDMYIYIYKYVKWSSLVHSYQQWVTVRHLPQWMSCHKAILIINRMTHSFHEYTQNVLKQKIKLEEHFVKNGYYALLYIAYHIIILLFYTLLKYRKFEISLILKKMSP